MYPSSRKRSRNLGRSTASVRSRISGLAFLILCLSSWPSLDLASRLCAQELILGARVQDAGKSVQRTNPRIQSEWGVVADQWSLRIAPDAKSQWGKAETPTFLLQIRNDSPETRTVELADDKLILMINGKRYRWNSPGTKLVTELKPGEFRRNLFVLRLDGSQWKRDDDSDAAPNGTLVDLDPGAKEIEVRVDLGTKSGRAQQLVSGKVKIKITDVAFEFPSVSGVLLDHAGNPVSNAEIFLCRDAQFSIYYSGYEGNWFKTRNINHYDPFRGGMAQPLLPAKTNAKGEFHLSPTFDDRRIVVLPEAGSAQVFELPRTFEEWQVRLQPTGSLLIEQDIEGETGTVNSSIHSSRRLAVSPLNQKQVFSLTESFNIPLSNGQKYELPNMAPEKFRFNRYKYARVGTRSYSIGRMNLDFVIEPAKQTEFRMVRTRGQRISLTATKIPQDMLYVMAGVYEVDEAINLEAVYANSTLWCDVSADNRNRLEFLSAKIPPGRYRVIVMSVPQAIRPNQNRYRPDHVGSKIVEVGESGKIDIGEIELLPSDVWIHNSGMAVKVRFEKANGENAGVPAALPVSIGYTPGFDAGILQTDSSGEATGIRVPGKYWYVAGLDDERATLFEIQVPRMTAQKVVVAEPVSWKSDAEKRPSLVAAARFESESGKLVFEIENRSDFGFRPRFGDVQFYVQLQANNRNSGVRLIPPPDSPIYSREIAGRTATKYEFEWSGILSSWLCTTALFGGTRIQEFDGELPEDRVIGALKFGPERSAGIPVPQLPEFKPKPFR